MLRTMAGRFARLAHEHDARIFRLQRNDFAIMLPVPAPGHREARMFAEKLTREAHRPVYWQGKSLSGSISVGITFYPDQATSRSELARQATLMREAAREDGGNALRIYDAEMDRNYNALTNMERLLRKAARNCATYFTLYFQPIVRLNDETLHGFEVLLRMHDDDGEPISPVVFIPLAERLNLMDEIGAFVLAEACAIASEWPDHLHVSVNLSPLQFESGHLPSAVWKALETSGLAPSRLELEVTENIVMRDWDKVHEQLDRVRARGVSLVLDDFGTGYSSMSYLWKFNFDKLKIDRSFTQAVSGSEEARSILRSLVVMARSLKLPLVVEGVETLEQASFLRKFRCDFAQGYYYGKPMPAHEVPAMILRDWQRREGRENFPTAATGTDAISA
jgi:EAL domain-containing protein (putative c-di-GMP-specific phosphodiesterase class I)